MENLSTRNCNPLNIRYTGDKWKGMTGVKSGFVVFEKDFFGYRAALKILLGYIGRGLRTPREIISTWAPPVENDTETYIRTVAYRSGLKADCKIETVGELVRLVKWMGYVERGSVSSYYLIHAAFYDLDYKSLSREQIEGYLSLTSIKFKCL